MSHTKNTSKNKAKLDKRDYIELKNFCAAEESTVKRQKQKIFANHVSGKRLIGKELLQTNNKVNITIKKWAKD